MATDLLSQNAPLIADLRGNMTSQQFRTVLLPLLRNFFANSSGRSRLITLAQGLAQLLPMRGAQQVLVARSTACCCMRQRCHRLSPWVWACRSVSSTLRLSSSQPDDHSSCSMHWYVLPPPPPPPPPPGCSLPVALPPAQGGVICRHLQGWRWQPPEMGTPQMPTCTRDLLLRWQVMLLPSDGAQHRLRMSAQPPPRQKAEPQPHHQRRAWGMLHSVSVQQATLTWKRWR